MPLRILPCWISWLTKRTDIKFLMVFNILGISFLDFGTDVFIYLILELKRCEGSSRNRGARSSKETATRGFTETTYIYNCYCWHCCYFGVHFFPEKNRKQSSALAAAERIHICLCIFFIWSFDLSVSEIICKYISVSVLNNY